MKVSKNYEEFLRKQKHCFTCSLIMEQILSNLTLVFILKVFFLNVEFFNKISRGSSNVNFYFSFIDIFAKISIIHGACKFLIDNGVLKILAKLLCNAKDYPYLVNATLNLLIAFSQK
jgi:hypothetical protein